MAHDNRTPGEIASDYQSVVRLVEILTPGFVIVANRDPKRVAIRFWLAAGTPGAILPEPGQSVTATFSTDNTSGCEYHLRDWGSVVTGEWYAFIGGGIGQLYVIESLYMR